MTETCAALHVERFRPCDHPATPGRREPLGFAVQLCYLRFAGRALGVDEIPEAALLELLVKLPGIRAESWDEYAKRPQTRVEHFAELQTWLGSEPSICLITACGP